MERCERGLEVVMRSPVHGLAESMAESRYTYERAATNRANITPLWCRKTSANFVSAGRPKGTEGRNRTLFPFQSSASSSNQQNPPSSIALPVERGKTRPKARLVNSE